jgi:hypothetical protein
MRAKKGHPSVQDFAANVQDYIARMKRADMPMVLSVDGEPAVVVFDIRLFEFLGQTGQRELGEILESRIRQVDSGEDEGIPVEQMFRELRAELAARAPKRGKKRK